MRILRAADRRETPWRNRGGITREVAVFPAGAGFDTFDWRISIATVRTDGPFSHLPGIDRRLAVLEGRIALQVANQAWVELSADSPALELAGEAVTHARLLGEPVTDLNVMTRRGRFRSTLVRNALQAAAELQTRDTTTVLVAASALRVAHQGATHDLGSGDAAVFGGPSHAVLTPLHALSAYYLIEVVDLQVKK